MAIPNYRKRLIIISLISSAIIAAGIYVGVQAFSGFTVFGRGNGIGYFDGKIVSCSDCDDANYVLPVIAIEDNRPVAIPSSIKTVGDISTKGTLMNFLYDANTSGNAQKHTGSAFIVYTMLGRNGSSSLNRTVSSADWAELTKRLKDREIKGKINWSGNVFTYNLNKINDPDDNAGNCMNSLYGDSGNDDAFYSNKYSCRNEPGIKIFDDNNKTIYQLSRVCANPLGKIGPLPTVIDVPPPAPTGDICRPILIDISQYIRTDWYGNTVPVYVTANGKQFGGYTIAPANGVDVTSACTTGDIITVKIWTNNYVYDREAIMFTPPCTGSGVSLVCPPAYQTGWKYLTRSDTNYKDVGPCYDYLLTPQVDNNMQYIETNQDIIIKPSVKTVSWTSVYYLEFYNKYKTHTKSKNTTWQIIRTINGLSSVYKSGTAVFDNNVNSNVNNGNAVVLSGSLPASVVYNVENYDPGTIICFVLLIRPDSSDTNNEVYSSEVCSTVVKKPKIQILGGDLSAGGLVRTSLSDKNIGGIHRFGSWSEYGIFAGSSITGMASGSAFAAMKGLASNPINNTSCKILSFANDGNSSCNPTVNVVGGYAPKKAIVDVASSFPINTSTPYINSGSLDGLQGVYRSDKNINISGGNIKKGQWVVINAPDINVTIDGDINYTNETLHNVSDIPQVVIIAKNIRIADSVTSVNSWLISKGIINTCAAVSEGSGTKLTADICNRPLVVNGPVIAQKLYLYRTAGSGYGDESGHPAEVFNLRSDAYLWSAARAVGTGYAQTVHTVDIPPRN